MGETPPTNGTIIWLLRCVGGNVLVKFRPKVKPFSAKYARKLNRIFRMLYSMMFHSFVFAKVGFFTAGEYAGHPGSIHGAVDFIDMSFQMLR